MGQDALRVDAPNSALFQDDLLMQVVQPLDMGYPMGPSFVHALGTLIEAVVLHDINYFDPLATFTTEGSGLQAYVRQSSLINDLQRGGALRLLPPAPDVDLRFEQLGIDYRMLDLVGEINWTNKGSSFTNPASEAAYVGAMTHLLRGFPALFASLDILDANDDPVTAEAEALMRMGVDAESLILIEGQNHRLAALQSFCQPLRLNLCTNHASLPNHLGMVRHNNSVARRLYAQMTRELGELDDDTIDDDELSAIEMPELSRLVLRNCKGDLSALSNEILAVRDKHRKLRDYLTAYEEAWRTASTKGERSKLQNEFNNAWEALVRQHRQPRDRIVYRLWGVLKNPTQILAALGDELVKLGRTWAVSGQVRGLHTLWADLLDAPTARENFSLLASFGMGVADDDLWKAHLDLADTVHQHVAASGGLPGTGGRTGN